MLIDETTYKDLTIFQGPDDFTVFNRLNFANTIEGREQLWNFFKHPLKDIKKILEVQDIVKSIEPLLDQWPVTITNGTLMVIVKYFDSNLDVMPKSGYVNALAYKIFNNPDYAIVRFSVPHFIDMLHGMRQLVNLLQPFNLPQIANDLLTTAEKILNRDIYAEMLSLEPGATLTVRQNVYFGKYLKENARFDISQLIAVFGKFDAWYSMAIAKQHFNMSFPELIDQPLPHFSAKGLFHLLLEKPVDYDIQMDEKSNFIFLTGANMAGKSTFIKAVGIAVFLAHIGMPVPAQSASMTVFNGLLSNINVVDNLFKGESYFFNEVQRIKNTITTITGGNKWLVLIDELFKGTNVEDAMRCSTAVIKGLLKIDTSLFILSTHLYEIGEGLKSYNNISFRYFETHVTDDTLSFSYQLKEGISKDRLGYLILSREGVVDLLEKI